MFTKLLARWYAKVSYLWQLEVEARKGEINAALSKQNAETSRKLAAQLNAEADAIEANIKQVEAEEEVRKSAPEYQALTPKEQYDDQQASKAEKDAAVQMMTEKRGLAKAEIDKIPDREQTAQTLGAMAQNSRQFADRIRSL